MEKKNFKLSLLYCSNSINSSELLRSVELHENFIIKTISLSCSGRVNIQYLLKAMETGADGVILLTCPQGECKYVEGNLRAKKRVMAVNSLLREAGFTNDRIMVAQADVNDKPEQIIEKIINTCNKIINVPQEGNITV